MSNNKRIFDMVVTLLALPLWLPVMAITAIAILITSGWPIFYFSRRYVKKGSYRTVVKFRAMVKNAEKIANRKTIKPVVSGKMLNIVIDNSLYTRIGKFLEKSHFTELPQLVQVLSGALTLVGNRPMPENMRDVAKKLYPYLDERFSIAAGITGPAQLAGRDKLMDVERLRLEIIYCYICQYAYSPLLDLILLAITILTPFGYYKDLSVDSMEALMLSSVKQEAKRRQILELVNRVMT